MVRKRKCKAVVVEPEDRISNLPDNILYHILSYVPTKDVVHTCVLSKQWKYIWKGIHTFDFREKYDNGNLNSKIDFLNYVKKFLLHHDGSVINKLQLGIYDIFSFYDKSDDMKPHIEALLSTILSHKIQEIDLFIGTPILYPRRFFSYESFTVMKISGAYCSFRLPASVYFPSLKIMHLKSITFASKKRIQQVSLSCPVLEELEFQVCNRVRTVDMFVPELKRLKIEGSVNMPHYYDNEIKIHAKCLDLFHVTYSLPCAFSFCNLSSLNSATIDIGSHDFARDLVQSIQNVKELKLSHFTFAFLHCVKDLHALSNLQTLTLNHVTSLTGKFLTELLCSVPQIRSFILNTMLHQSEGYDFTAVEIPNSFLSQLKSIEIRQFQGEENEFYLVEMFLKNVRTIEKMIIVPCYDLAKNLKKQNEVMRRLLMLPRELTCVIDFSY